MRVGAMRDLETISLAIEPEPQPTSSTTPRSGSASRRRPRRARARALAVLIAVGLYSFYGLPIDAFPDLTNNQVVVVTECPAMAPSEVEMLVTFPMETALMGLPKTVDIWSVSKLGLSMVTVVVVVVRATDETMLVRLMLTDSQVSWSCDRSTVD